MRRALLIVLILAVPVTAQETPANPQGRMANPQPAPLTEIEALRVENANLERIIVQRAVNDWQAKVAKLKADIERARPGWAFNPDTGEWAAVGTK